MKTSTKRSLSLFLSVILLIAALAVYAKFIRAEYRTVRDLRASLAAKSNLLASQKIMISQVENLIAQYKGAVRLQETVSLALPDQAAAASVLQQINAISRVSGLLPQSITLNELAIKPGALGTVEVNLKLIGSYEGVKNFLRSLETNVRVMDLKKLSIAPAGKPKENLYSYSVVLDTYYQ